MTIGSVTMTYFGWLAICMEMTCITLKDCFLWQNSLQFRYGISKRVGKFIIFGLYIIAIVSGEYGRITGLMSVSRISSLLIFLCLYFFTENGPELMGRNRIYWLTCCLPLYAIEALTPFPLMQEGNISYYEDPAQILPNIALLVTAFTIMQYLWKKNVLGWVPKSFCVGLYLADYFSTWSYSIVAAGKAALTYFEILQSVTILIGITSISVTLVMMYSFSKKRKIHIATQCRKQFYQQICRVQREAGKFRHDLANHMQVLNAYEDEREKEKYAGKLKKRKQELQLANYSNNIAMDFILNQMQEMAQQNGYRLDIRWEAGEVTNEEIKVITDQCLEYLTKWYRRRNRFHSRKKERIHQISILHKGGEMVVCGKAGVHKNFI